MPGSLTTRRACGLRQGVRSILPFRTPAFFLRRRASRVSHYDEREEGAVFRSASRRSKALRVMASSVALSKRC